MTITSSTVAAFIQSSSTASSSGVSGGIIAAIVVSVVVLCVVVIVVLMVRRRRSRRTELIFGKVAKPPRALEWDETHDALPDEFFKKGLNQRSSEVSVVKDIVHSLKLDRSAAMQTFFEPEGFLGNSRSQSFLSQKGSRTNVTTTFIVWDFLSVYNSD
jgi:hypothetical protein